MSTRVMAITCTGAEVLGRTSDLGANGGLVYVVLDSGSAGSFPAERVHVIEDKTQPRVGFETK